ncbi:hypothetical protein GYMLUDRAFT_37938 [Collybiopsis luxurians FD-317 M1]|nr:hypothetical protein GYMLUDRAFT_37938 [Collybiopsis luxurians FD-317 M1]
MSQIDPKNVTSSTQAFFTALIANTALLAVEVGLFLVLKERLKRIYSPRTYLPPSEKRSPKLPSGPWKWLPALVNSRAEDIIDKNGLDAYMFLRFLKMLIQIFLVFTIVTFAVLIPVDFIGQHGGKSSLDRITWTNVTEAKEQKRFLAHIVVVYVLTLFVIYQVRREMGHFVALRQRFLLSPAHSRLAQARTVLITSVPDTLSTEASLRQFASFVPGGVERIWLYRDTKKLNKLFNERNKRCTTLEKAVSEILRDAIKAWRKKEAARRKRKAKGIPKARSGDVEAGQGGAEPLSDDEGLLEREPSMKLLDELVPAKRPKNRTGPLGLIGDKVDTLEWCKDEIVKLNSEIDSARASHSEQAKFLGSVFILCNLQMGAHILAQCVSYHKVLQMNDKFIETHPADIVWHNLDDDALKTRSKVTMSWMITIGLIILYSFPVAFIGTLSNVGALCKNFVWLEWICHAPTSVQSLIQGLLPPVLLAALFAVMPFVLRGLAWYEGLPRHSLISVSLYRRFFLFLLIHGFLIVTLSSGLTQVLEEIFDNPTHTVQQMARKLPGASLFFLTYMVTQGLAGAGSALAQLFQVLGYYFGKWFLGRTPRQAFNVTFLMPSADFGTLLPRLSLLATIGFAYSALNPLINLLAFITYGCYYIAWKFLFLQVFDQPESRESGGGYFPMAVSNLFVGLYIEQICLASLFFLKSSEPVSRFVALTQGILMLVLFAITVWAHVLLNRSFAPLTQYLPMSLATKDLADRFGQGGGGGGGEMDLFSQDFMENVRKRIGKKMDKTPFETVTARMRLGFDSSGSSSASPSGRRRNRGAPAEDLERGNGDGEASSSGAGSAEVVTEANADLGLNAGEGERVYGDDGASPDGRPGKVESSLVEDAQEGQGEGEGKADTSDARALNREEEGSQNQQNAPSPPLPNLDTSEVSSSSLQDSLDEHAFDHPSTYAEQPYIWIPRDPLGLSRVLVEYLEGAGVRASDEGAVMDVKGVVEVTKAPPESTGAGSYSRL